MNEKVAKWGNWVLFAVSIPMVVVGWLWVVFSCAFFFARSMKFGPYGVLTAQWRDWFVKHWKYSTTIGRAIIYQPTASDATKDHEMVHIRQFEDSAMAGLLIALIVLIVSGNVWLSLGLWLCSQLLLAVNYVTSVLRGGHIYRDSEHERSASAQTTRRASGKSWLSGHLSKPRDW